MFNWLRISVKQAVLAGINDAVEIMQSQGADEHDDAEHELEQRIRLLPAPESKTKRGGGK